MEVLRANTTVTLNNDEIEDALLSWIIADAEITFSTANLKMNFLKDKKGKWSVQISGEEES